MHLTEVGLAWNAFVVPIFVSILVDFAIVVFDLRPDLRRISSLPACSGAHISDIDKDRDKDRDEDEGSTKIPPEAGRQRQRPRQRWEKIAANRGEKLLSQGFFEKLPTTHSNMGKLCI